MTTWNDAFSGNAEHLLELVLTENSTNSTNNTSSVTATLRVNPPSDSTSYNLFNDGDWTLVFDGTTYTGSWGYDFRTDRSTKTLKTVSKVITHAANGTGSVSASGSADAGSGTLGSASITTKTLTLTDFVRLPSAPAIPTLSRSSDGATVTVTSGIASSPVSVSDYDMRYSIDQTSWTTVAIGIDRIGTFASAPTTTYYVQTRGVSSEGDGAWSATASIAGLPSAPASITTTRVARDVTVVSGTAAGSGINGYWVQYSTDGGSTWSTAVAMVDQSYTYTALTAALTYVFRVYATNSIGSSAYTVSDSVYVSAGGKRWDGSAWISNATAKRWDGSAWVDLSIAKRWDGSAWTDLG